MSKYDDWTEKDIAELADALRDADEKIYKLVEDNRRMLAAYAQMLGVLRGIVGMGKSYAFDNVALPALAERMYFAAERAVNKAEGREE